MKRKAGKRLLAFCLSILLLFSNASLVSATEQTDGTAGSFYLSAVTEDKNLIEPTAVSYTAGQTVREALQNSEYTFQGLETDGYIYAIQGEAGSYSIYMSDGEYDLDRKASEVSVVAFYEGNFYSSEMVDLITKMGEINTNYSSVKDIAAIKTAYDEALEGLRSADSTKAAKLLSSLNSVFDEYESSLKADKVTVTISAVQDGKILEAPVVTFSDKYGNDTTVTGTTVSVVPGEYTFSVSDGGYNRTEGKIKVEERTTLSVELPSGEWFGDIQILNSSKAAYDYAIDAAKHSAEYYLPDICGTLGARIYAVPGEDVPTEDGKVLADLYACYVSLSPEDDGSYNDYGLEDKSANERSWKSTASLLKGLVLEGMEGRNFRLEARYTDTDGYRQIQSYDMNIYRVPTLTSLTATDGNGASLLSGFAPTVKEYKIDTIDDVLDIETTTYGQDGYSVSVESANMDSSNPNRVYIPETAATAVPVKVTVSYTNGQTYIYTLSVTRVAAATVTLNVPDGVTVQVLNKNNSVVSPKSGTVYDLVPGETYTYIATKQENYHTMAEFTAVSGTTIQVAEPLVETAVSDIALYDSGSTSIRVEYEADSDFSTDDYAYSYVASDAVSYVYVQATPENSYTVTARYYQQHIAADSAYNGILRTQDISNRPVSSTGTAQNLLRSLAKCAYQNEVVIRGWKTSSDKSVTYYQDYVLTINRSLHLESLAVKNGTDTLTMLDADDNINAFDRDVKEYYVQIPTENTSVQICAAFMNEADTNELCGGYYAMINGERYDDISNLTFALDPEKETEEIVITVCHKETSAVSNTYTIHVKKVNPVAITFVTNPKDAVVFVESQLDGKSPEGKDNVFQLIPGQKYTYTVTCNGYVGVQVKDYEVSSTVTSVSVALTKAAENKDLQNLDSQWSSFRGDENNNGTVEAATPIKDEDAVLYWATKVGEGYDSGATGCPILVDGYLYTYAGNSIVKVDTLTGEIVASGKMTRSSSFAINSPTYGDGMIFVGLSNGGVQAFDAVTLESLWIYNDVLKGQPNTELTYHDGYLYTGFWTGEDDDAHYVCISVTDEDPTKTDEEKLPTWTHTQKGGFYWAGAYVCDEFVLVGTDDGESGYETGYAHVLSIDPKTGNIIDDIQLPFVGDIRSNMVYDAEGTKDYYFTSKGGYFYKLSVNSDGTFGENALSYIKLENGSAGIAMSTSTPTVYNGRAYVGVSGTGQFSAYSGHNITVIDLVNWKIAYRVPTQGYPQTSGILTTAYGEDSDKVYVYFIDNYTPGKIRMISDQPGQTAPAEVTQESYTSGGDKITVDTAYVLFTPSGSQAQYAICSPIVDEYGNMYFKNDSGYMMMLGSTIEKMEVTKLPKTEYLVGDTFDSTGMEVTLTYSNGTKRVFSGEDVDKYITYSKKPLTTEDQEFQLTFEHVKYQNKGGETAVEYTAPMAILNLTVTEKKQIENPFVDVKENEWYYDAVLWAVDEDITTGITPTTFVPDGTCTRAQAVTFLWRIQGSPEPKTTKNPFADVKNGEWYYKAVLWAVENGITTGTSNTTFSPEETVTRGQFVTFLWRMNGEPTPVKYSNFSDVPSKEYYYKAVSWAAENNITNGMTPTTFEPDGTCVRSQVVTFLYRAYVENK